MKDPPSEFYDRFDIVVLPFPFTDRSTMKRRPALILSNPDYQKSSGHLICAMVTTAARSKWPGDTTIAAWVDAGLPKPSKVRLKLFTLDARFVIRRLGKLVESDASEVTEALSKTLN
ncbi:MAG: type II toxin-antitoxin system PemK/MazF family toxin [Verrucomicrobia bacterium]|jgi:mRNA interferase MazF|nr:type II toxin-antitoxin system PemK/MazF family toxin [Verrucomicrobiota bacterium]